MSSRNARNRPAVPGQMCPAERTNSSRDPKVTVTETGRHWRKGTRPCGRCGRPDVPVQQSWGDRTTAWYYGAHTVPTQPIVQDHTNGSGA